MFFAFLVGVPVAVVAFLNFSPWGAIHSGMSPFWMEVWGHAFTVVPPALGIFAGWVTYRMTARTDPAEQLEFKLTH